jgi:hypothetical protein
MFVSSSVRLYVRMEEEVAHHWTDFHEILYFSNFGKKVWRELF